MTNVNIENNYDEILKQNVCNENYKNNSRSRNNDE